MATAFRAITRVRDADDVNVAPDISQDGYALTYNHEAGNFVLAPGGVSGTFTWDAATTEAGAAQNRTTGSTYSRQTGRLTVYQPLKITAFKIDIAVTGTYKLGLTVGNSTTYAVTLVASKVVSATGENIFTPDGGAYVLLPGTHFLTIQSLSGAVNWHDRNVSSLTCELFSSDLIYYDGTSFSNYTMPVRFVAYRGAAT